MYANFGARPETVWERYSRVYETRLVEDRPWNLQPLAVRGAIRAQIVATAIGSDADAARELGPRPANIAPAAWRQSAASHRANEIQATIRDDLDAAILASQAVQTMNDQLRQAALIEAQNAAAFAKLTKAQQDKYGELQATAPRTQRVGGMVTAGGEIAGIGGRLDRAARGRTLLDFASRYRPPPMRGREESTGAPGTAAASSAGGVVSGGEALPAYTSPVAAPAMRAAVRRLAFGPVGRRVR